MCFKLLLLCPQIENKAWEWSYGKYDEQEFTGLNIVWVGTILDGIFWIAIIWVGIFQVGVILDGSFPGGNFPGGSYPGWGISGWELFRGNHPGGSFPSTKFTESVFCIHKFKVTRANFPAISVKSSVVYGTLCNLNNNK